MFNSDCATLLKLLVNTFVKLLCLAKGGMEEVMLSAKILPT